MENKRKSQIAIIAVLAVAVVALGVGFAAFSTALTITSSATVTPDSSTFQVVFANSSDVITTGTTISPALNPNNVNDFTAGTATIDNDTNQRAPILSGLQANFTAPGQTVTYTLKVKNTGEYDAYLNSIDFKTISGVANTAKKTCTANLDSNDNALATQTYVDEACGLISLSIQVQGQSASDTTVKASGEGIKLAKGASDTVVVTITYAEPAANAQTAGTYGRADGPFTVTFGDIQLNYSTVQ